MDGAPRHVVEAQSYGPLITLAANPPRYPRNPCKAPLKPLVLYIVRVPGSRGTIPKFPVPHIMKPPSGATLSYTCATYATYAVTKRKPIFINI